jgi:hypothetical protein
LVRALGEHDVLDLRENNISPARGLDSETIAGRAVVRLFRSVGRIAAT